MSEQIYFGGAVKAMGEPGRVGGYLVTFGDATRTDLDGDYFTKATYFGARAGDGVDTVFHHGRPLPVGPVDAATKAKLEEMRGRFFAPVKTRVDEIGIFAEVVLNMADEYEAAVYGLAKAGKLGWSSGAVSHLVKREPDGWLKCWPIGEASLTPMPAEPRNRAFELKSLDAAYGQDQGAPEGKSVKAMFEEALTGRAFSVWELHAVYGDVVARLADAAKGAAAIGGRFDYAGLLADATMEYAARMEASAGQQIEAHLTDASDAKFYFKSLDVEADGGLDSHISGVVSALGGLVGRFVGNRIARANQKAGRMLSARNKDRIVSVLQRLEEARAAMQALLEDADASSIEAERLAEESKALRLRWQARKLEQ